TPKVGWSRSYKTVTKFRRIGISVRKQYGVITASGKQARSYSTSLFLRWGRMPFQIPKPQYSLFNLSCEIVWQVNNAAVSPSATVRLIRSLWHLNESLLAFRLNDLYVRNANHPGDIHCRKTPKRTSLKFLDFFDPNVHMPPARQTKSLQCRLVGSSLNVETICKFYVMIKREFS